MSNLNLKPKQTYFNVSPQLHKDKQNLCSMHHVLWLTTLAAWDHFTRKREMKTYGCMIWQVLLCCIQLQNFFFLKEGKCFAFVSAVVYERKNKCDGSPNLHCQPVIFTHQLRSPIKIPCSITCIYWHMDLKGRGTHISVSSTFTNCIHSLTGTITLTYTLRFEKELLEINMDKRIFFCWYGGCTLLHTVNVRVTVWVTISPHYQTHRTPLKHTKADSGLGKKRKKAESMASNNAGQESP